MIIRHKFVSRLKPVSYLHMPLSRLKEKIFGHKHLNILGGRPCLVVMREDSCSEGRGFETRHRILDGHFSHVFVVKIGMMFV